MDPIRVNGKGDIYPVIYEQMDVVPVANLLCLFRDFKELVVDQISA